MRHSASVCKFNYNAEYTNFVAYFNLANKIFHAAFSDPGLKTERDITDYIYREVNGRPEPLPAKSPCFDINKLQDGPYDANKLQDGLYDINRLQDDLNEMLKVLQAGRLDSGNCSCRNGGARADNGDSKHPSSE